MSKMISNLLAAWVGLIVGVSFIATPAKFLAPHFMMSVALEVGKATFHIFTKVEWVICIIVATITIFSNLNLRRWVFIGGLFVLLSVKTFFLLPALDVKADRVIAGDIANPGILHWLYIVADILEIVLAAAGSFWFMRQNR